MFMYRNMTGILESSKRLMLVIQMPQARMIDSDLIAAVLPLFRMNAFLQNCYGSKRDKMAVINLIPSLSLVGNMATQVCSQIKYIQKLRADGLWIPSVMYDHIIVDPEKTTRSLFGFLQISRHHLPRALAAMKKRSHVRVPGMDMKTPPRSSFQLLSQAFNY